MKSVIETNISATNVKKTSHIPVTGMTGEMLMSVGIILKENVIIHTYS